MKNVINVKKHKKMKPMQYILIVRGYEQLVHSYINIADVFNGG